MPTKITATEQAVTRPEFFRLPRAGAHDEFFQLSRSFYYELDKRFLRERGEKLLLHICAQGKHRGVTVIPFAKMAAYMREQQEAQG